MMSRRFGGLAVALLLLSCSSHEKSDRVPCVDADARCGRPCNDALICPEGLYCSSKNVCAKECVAGKPSCANGGMCLPSGMCGGGQAAAGSSGAGAGGAGSAGRGGASAPGTVVPAAGAGAVVGSGSLPACGDTVVQAMRVTPTVTLVIDQSGSMGEDFSGRSRWDALRESLLGEPSGLITALQSQVQFGVALYSATAEDGPVQGACPMLTSVPAALNNRAGIAAVYETAEPIDETPTGDAITLAVQQLNLPASFDPLATPHAFILATDGEPDRCEDPNPDTDAANAMAKQEVVDAVTAAFMRGIRTFVISVGDDLSAEHQRAVANAGVGHQAGQPDAPFWRAGDDQDLRMALTEIVGTQISCDISLNTSVQGNPCTGTVTLQNTPLTCNDPNGWQLLDPTHIRLMGTACTSLNADPSSVLKVSFPCDVLQ